MHVLLDIELLPCRVIGLIDMFNNDDFLEPGTREYERRLQECIDALPDVDTSYPYTGPGSGYGNEHPAGHQFSSYYEFRDPVLDKYGLSIYDYGDWYEAVIPEELGFEDAKHRYIVHRDNLYIFRQRLEG